MDKDGDKIVSYTYDAWGNVLTTTGSKASTVGRYNPLRYRGYVYDTETELYYLQSRYYNPKTGRFLNADAFASTGQGLLGNNTFAYCGNNPTSHTDPDGYAQRYFSTCIGMLPGGGYSNLGGNATGVSSISPTGGPDGVPMSIGGLFQSVITFFKGSDKRTSKLEQQQSYNYNGSKSEKYVKKRGWTDDMIRYTMKNGQKGSSVNMANNASCTVYKYPGTSNQYVVIDDSTGSIVQVSNFHDSGWIIDSRIQWSP